MAAFKFRVESEAQLDAYVRSGGETGPTIAVSVGSASSDAYVVVYDSLADDASAYTSIVRAGNTGLFSAARIVVSGQDGAATGTIEVAD